MYVWYHSQSLTSFDVYWYVAVCVCGLSEQCMTYCSSQPSTQSWVWISPTSCLCQAHPALQPTSNPFASAGALSSFTLSGLPPGTARHYQCWPNFEPIRGAALQQTCSYSGWSNEVVGCTGLLCVAVFFLLPLFWMVFCAFFCVCKSSIPCTNCVCGCVLVGYRFG